MHGTLCITIPDVQQILVGRYPYNRPHRLWVFGDDGQMQLAAQAEGHNKEYLLMNATKTT